MESNIHEYETTVELIRGGVILTLLWEPTTTAILWTGFLHEIRQGRTVAAQMGHAELDSPAS